MTDKDTSAHTETPWKKVHAIIDGNVDKQDSDEKYAAHCVNNFDELVEALKMARELIVEMSILKKGEIPKGYYKDLEKIQVRLTKANPPS